VKSLYYEMRIEGDEAQVSWHVAKQRLTRVGTRVSPFHTAQSIP